MSRQRVRLHRHGQLEYGMSIHGRIMDATIHRMEETLGDRHGTGEVGKQTCIWYLTTPLGPAAIADWWAFNEGEYAIWCHNDAVAKLVIDYLISHKIHAYRKPQYD